jgi:type IV secretory pathway TraG/TraD family ATPase VirD4
MVIVQNLGQLKRHYETGWTFIANSGVITAFGNADMETLDYLGRKLGNVSMMLSRKSGASSSASWAALGLRKKNCARLPCCRRRSWSGCSSVKSVARW